MPSIAELREISSKKKTAKKDFLLNTGYFVHRKVSIYITWILLQIFPGVRPNVVSFLMLGIGIGGAALLWSSNTVYGIMGLLLVYVSFLLDKVDGEIARFKNMHSYRGMYLDEMYHLIVPALLFVSYFSVVAENNSVYVLFLILIIFLTVFRRYERKIPIILSVKSSKKEVQKDESTSVIVQNVFSSIFVKWTSLVERFDIQIILFSGVLLLNVYSIDLREELFLFYVFVSLVYSLRFFFLHYFGGVSEEIKRLRERGY
jgi:phosphatidylglycerophosphate synthase